MIMAVGKYKYQVVRYEMGMIKRNTPIKRYKELAKIIKQIIEKWKELSKCNK